jgi:hypothetical protein
MTIDERLQFLLQSTESLHESVFENTRQIAEPTRLAAENEKRWARDEKRWARVRRAFEAFLEDEDDNDGDEQ